MEDVIRVYKYPCKVIVNDENILNNELYPFLRAHNYYHWAFPGTMGKQSYELALNSFNQKLENCKNELYEAWGRHEELWHQTISDLYNGVVNIITQGVWLSYPKVNIERIKGGFRIITIRTGERFLTKKSRCSKWGRTKYTIIKKLS